MSRAASEEVIPGRAAISVNDPGTDVPEGWTRVRLTDIARLESGHTPSRSHPEWWGGDVPWVSLPDAREHHGRVIHDTTQKTNELGLANSAARWLPKDTVCLSRTASVGYVFRLGRPMATSQDFVNWVCSPAIEPRFLMHALLAEGKHILNFGMGSTHTTIYFPAVLAFHITLAPLPEQHRIVEAVEALLEQVNRARERLDRVPLILKRFRQAVLAAACSGRLTEEWREAHLVEPAESVLLRMARNPDRERRYPGGHLVRTDLDLPEIPGTWAWTDLRFLADPSEALCYGVVQPGDEVTDGVPLVRSGDLHDLRGSIATLRLISRSIDAAYKRSRLLGGEILVTVVGANIGTSALAPRETNGFNIARAVAKIPVRDVDARYVLLWLRSSLAHRWMFGDAREVARPTLNIEQLESLPVPLPPVLEQAEIVRQVERLFALADALERRVNEATARADKLPQAILSKAFSGELVPTEADLARAEGRTYETAELLARLAGEGHAASIAVRPAPKNGRVPKRRAG